ncbi:MAG: hypothetical protein WC495_07345 [Patescibacteria group bacterium]|jgi:hypothetical protein
MRTKKIKTEETMDETPKRKRGRPRKVVETKKEAVVVVTPKKRGRPRKEEAMAVAPKKRGRPRKVKETKEETKEETLHKVAKLGKRKRNQAIEQMAIEKINKKVRRKNGSLGNGESHGEVVSVTTFGFRDEDIIAGPNKMPEGRRIFLENEAKRLAEPKPKVKIPNLPKTELNRYIRRLKERGIKPMNIKVIENTPQYFRIEFNDGANGPLTTCGHVKGWDL